MTDEGKKVQEDKVAEDAKKNLNWGEEKKTFTLDEVKEREDALKKEISWNHEKWVQKLTSKQKVLTTVLDNLDTIAEKPEKLIDLFSENEEAAKIILDKYYDGQSIEDFKSDIWYTPDYSDPKVVEKLADDKANKKYAKRLMDEKKDNFIKSLEMSWDELVKFEAEFEDRKWLKSFSADTIQKHLESAYRDSNGNSEALKKVKKDQAIADAMWTWEWKSGSKDTKKKITSFDKARAEAKEMLWKYL